MKVFQMDSRPNALLFTNYDRIDEELLYQQVKDMLEQNPSVSWGEKISGPSEELQQCNIEGFPFLLIYDFDYGTEIRSDTEDAIQKLIKYFNS